MNCACNTTGRCGVGITHLDGIGHAVQSVIAQLAQDLAEGRARSFDGIFTDHLSSGAAYVAHGQRGMYCHSREYIPDTASMYRVLSRFLCSRGPDLNKWFNLQPMAERRVGVRESRCLQAELATQAHPHAIATPNAWQQAWQTTLEHVQRHYYELAHEPRPSCKSPGQAMLALHLRLGDMIKAKPGMAARPIVAHRINATIQTFAHALDLARRTVASFNAFVLPRGGGLRLAVRAFTDLDPDFDLARLPAVIAQHAGMRLPRLSLPNNPTSSPGSLIPISFSFANSDSENEEVLELELAWGGHPLRDLHCLSSADVLVPAASYFSVLASYYNRGLKVNTGDFACATAGTKARRMCDAQHRAQNEMGQGYLTWQPGNNDDQITTQLVAKLQKAACASRATQRLRACE